MKVENKISCCNSEVVAGVWCNPWVGTLVEADEWQLTNWENGVSRVQNENKVSGCNFSVVWGVWCNPWAVAIS